MLQTIEVEIDASGHIHPMEPLTRVPIGHALLTMLTPVVDEATLLSQTALAEEWLTKEEDVAWAHLQPGR
jgi:hypothetical protein